MRLCANENLPGDCIHALRAAGHDVCWIRETLPGASDDTVLAWAAEEERLLLTFDKDFGDLVYQRGQSASPGIVLFRISQTSSADIALAATRILASRSDWLGHFSVVDDHFVRMRKLV